MLIFVLACATHHDIEVLQARVEELEADQEKLKSRIAALEAPVDSTIEDPALPHCPPDFHPAPFALTDARFMPHRDADGVLDGYRISGIRRKTWVDCGGLRNGDVLLRVDGAAITDPTVLETALARDPATWNFDLLRRMKPVEIRPKSGG